MTDRERASMLRASMLLLAAAVLRTIVTPARTAPPLEHRPSVADSLLTAGDSAAEDRDRRARPMELGETLDPNTASDVELDRLPGVGAAKALRIVADREANGPFHRVDDLTRVPGLGPLSVERLRPFLRIPSVGPRAPQRLAKGAQYQRRLLGVADRTVGGPGGSVPRVDVNRATAVELQQLPGIGPVIAERIVQLRTSIGGFTSPGQLEQVPGIGAKTLARLAPLITIRP